MLVGFVAGYARLEARQNVMETDLHAHEAYDDKRFEAFATKESRSMRDQTVDAKLDALKAQIADLKADVSRLVEMHMKNPQR
jgi:hypothetical protein